MTASPRGIAILGLISRHPGGNRGGSRIYVARLANHFARRGTRVDIFALRSATADGWPEPIEELVTLHQLRRSSKAAIFTAVLASLRRLRPELLISVDMRAARIALWLQRYGVVRRIWVTLQNDANLNETPSNMRLLRKIARRSEGVVAVSHGLARRFIEITKAPPDKVHVIHNPIVGSQLDEMASDTVSHPWLDRRDRTVLLAVGRLERVKGFDVLLRAFARVRRTRACRLIILGEGSRREELESLARQLDIVDDVEMPGHVMNPYAFMKRADLLVVSSRSEGFGNVLVEAMALGTPVVSADCPHGPREILDNGRYGMLVPPDEDERLSQAIQETLSRPPSSQFLRQRATDFDIEKQGDLYIDRLGL